MNQHVFPPNRPQEQEGPPPAINLPGVIVILAAVMTGIHVLQEYVFSGETNLEIMELFAFWPVRYLPDVFASGRVAGGIYADIWTFVTYGFLHGGWAHLFLNLMWMAAFGSAVVWRFGTSRFLILSGLCTVAGAALHLLTHYGEPVPIIGASAAVSGQMAAATRFVFELGAPLGAVRLQDRSAFFIPAPPLLQSLRNSRVLGMVLAWFGINFLFAFIPGLIGGQEGVSIAWEAHVGGFLAGLLLFPLLDPVPVRR
ncbi:rhomboid family intramembrane serine protease [Roseibium litorale]|uniref:Rhomboid family intramembrane serine protease n=1 Tax=Roseibium litorale TaxID=2803841 RepID=A0ABR9CHG2_9HYPH|nr:rhomboid family intramembrane serine protease [Roseibium litorale]MBD8890287.1 rhomboid family intramembrane serine protease [Roseibium litorale]